MSVENHPSTFNQIVNAIGKARSLDGPLNIRIGTTSAATIKNSVGRILFGNGAIVPIAAAETAFTATTHDIADPDANGREAVYLLLASTSGALTIVKGADAALGAGVDPAATANTVAIGRVKVAHNGTAIFDASTDLLSAAHLTVTYEDAAPYLNF